ncbi:MAG: hypothetical protein QF796_06565 [Acidimicrobiales bacterium]|jgi:hypothetical protein|nr:hypothetical protein [Acidimicrobiales bacterium]MDP6649782.1 hypothetical protein [Acidimicrobiales bacterium]MDP6759098.1 hypothetical protein [Acidimicrobiales bacterium]|tara:strand:- start:178 stop:678 length:501 start_codon:yes stop_codon:yes gene_type:complete
MARLLALVVVVVVVGCGSPDRPAAVDVEALEQAIPAGLVPDHPEVVTVVACPEITLDGLGPVSCTATISGVDIPVKVTRPDHLDQMRVSTGVSLVRAVDVAVEVGERLVADLGDVGEVTCDPPVRVARAGQQFTCIVIDPSSRAHRFVATLSGIDASFRLELVPKG